MTPLQKQILDLLLRLRRNAVHKPLITHDLAVVRKIYALRRADVRRNQEQAPADEFFSPGSPLREQRLLAFLNRSGRGSQHPRHCPGLSYDEGCCLRAPAPGPWTLAEDDSLTDLRRSPPRSYPSLLGKDPIDDEPPLPEGRACRTLSKRRKGSCPSRKDGNFLHGIRLCSRVDGIDSHAAGNETSGNL